MIGGNSPRLSCHLYTGQHQIISSPATGASPTSRHFRSIYCTFSSTTWTSHTSVTSVDRLHSNQVLSTRGSILSFSWCFTDVASITFGFFSSGSYPCFLFLSWQNIIMFTLIESVRQAIKGIMIVQLSSKNWRNITLVRPYVWMVFTHVPCGGTRLK